jgi:hypothetical protein
MEIIVPIMFFSECIILRKRGSTALPSRVPVTTHQLVALRQILDSGRFLHRLQGSIQHHNYVIMAEFDFPAELISPTKATLTTVKCCVKIQNDCSAKTSAVISSDTSYKGNDLQDLDPPVPAVRQ